jgi:hypothetical protein
MKFRASLLVALAALGGCATVSAPKPLRPKEQKVVSLPQNSVPVAHVLVALCDNRTQGIAPVPKAIGNGDDPERNLYWGTTLGTKRFLANHPDWTEIKFEGAPTEPILARATFRHRATGAYLVADAYRGSEMKTCLKDFLKAAAGHSLGSIEIGEKTLYLGGSAKLVGFLGHNGLMDTTVELQQHVEQTGTRDAIMLACKSQKYFEPAIKLARANPILWTTDLMAPEGYVLEAAVSGWAKKKTGSQIRTDAGRAYHKYQRCGLKGATKLFATGF